MLARAVVYAIFLLYLTLGATFTGIIQPQMRLMGVVGVILIGAAWLIARRRWRWHVTALDAAILVWIAAFVASLIANTDQARRIVMGMWYVGVYVLAWYLLHDLIANRIIARRVLMNALLLSGFLIIAFGYVQTRTWFTSSLPLMLSGALEFSLPRPVSTLGNANTLGAFLAVLLPFALEAARGGKGIARALMAIYALLVTGLLFLTYSRGAWVGAAAGVGAYGLLLIGRAGWLSPRRWRDFWSARSSVGRVVVGSTLAALVLIGVAGVFVVGRTYFSPGGRSVDARAWIYDTAWRIFGEQPITGSGLFTFGAGLSRLNGNPPFEPHAHAHNLFLHIAAELGVIGLIALAITALAAARSLQRNLRDDSIRLRADPVLIAGAGAFVAFAVHHLFDVTSLNPVIALIGLVTLVIVSAPVEPVPMGGIRLRAAQILVPVTVIVLGLSGLWSASIYEDYAAIIAQTASGTISPREAADRLQSVVDSDPRMPIYSFEQGFLYGLSGETQAGIAAFERYTQLDPDYSMGWANLFALYREAGDTERALTAIRRAQEISRGEIIITLHLAETEALLGDADGAREHYRMALLTDPDLPMLPGWNDDPIRAAALAEIDSTLSGAGRAITLLRAGDVISAREQWATSIYRSITPSTASSYVIDLLLALHEDDRVSANAALSIAQTWILNQGDAAWVHYGAACLARFDGDESAALAEIAAAGDALELDPFETDWQFGANIGYTQLMRTMIPRVFLPQVEFSIASPALISLLDGFSTTAETRHTSCP